jgi:mannose-1-phosphate guanylyltransferase/mannose-6-phosphate isomerase
MTSRRIIPIVLCGGVGARLWPASREDFPKQFLPLAGTRTLFQDALLRVADRSRFDAPIVVAHRDHRFIAAEQCAAIGVEALIALEPVRRDSGAALAAALRLAEARDPSGLALALPSDHAVSDPQRFAPAIMRGVAAASEGRIVVFGAPPQSPATRYGYIRLGAALVDGVAEVAAFVEKPDHATAERLIAEGCLWNSGNLLGRVDVLLDEMRRLAPGVAEPAIAAADAAEVDLDFLRLDPAAFARATALSVDYAMLEKTPLAVVAPADFGWSDVGSWPALWDIASKDANGNALLGPAAALDASNCYVRSDRLLTAVVGLDDAIVVVTDDAVLVAGRGRVDGVKAMVAELSARGEPAAVSSRRAHRPWGAHQVIDEGEGFRVNRVSVAAGKSVSLQTHRSRAEHWIVVRGAALVTIGEETRLVGENESVQAPPGEAHRLENPGPGPLEMIEVQSGPYLGEDDVVRLDEDGLA